MRHALVLCGNLREFGGCYSVTPIVIYIPPEFRGSVAALVARLDKSRVTRRETSFPPEGLRYYYARKVYAAAKSEEQRDDKGKVLVWLDEDSVR